MQPSPSTAFPSANVNTFETRTQNHPMRQTSTFQPGPGRGQQDFFNQFSQFVPSIVHLSFRSSLMFVRNPMAGVAMSTASDFLQKQSQAYIPGLRIYHSESILNGALGAYGVWGRLKHYFTVDNNYVKNRLKVLHFNFLLNILTEDCFHRYYCFHFGTKIGEELAIQRIRIRTR